MAKERPIPAGLLGELLTEVEREIQLVVPETLNEGPASTKAWLALIEGERSQVALIRETVRILGPPKGQYHYHLRGEEDLKDFLSDPTDKIYRKWSQHSATGKLSLTVAGYLIALLIAGGWVTVEPGEEAEAVAEDLVRGNNCPTLLRGRPLVVEPKGNPVYKYLPSKFDAEKWRKKLAGLEGHDLGIMLMQAWNEVDGLVNAERGDPLFEGRHSKELDQLTTLEFVRVLLGPPKGDLTNDAIGPAPGVVGEVMLFGGWTTPDTVEFAARQWRMHEPEFMKLLLPYVKKNPVYKYLPPEFDLKKWKRKMEEADDPDLTSQKRWKEMGHVIAEAASNLDAVLRKQREEGSLFAGVAQTVLDLPEERDTTFDQLMTLELLRELLGPPSGKYGIELSFPPDLPTTEALALGGWLMPEVSGDALGRDGRTGILFMTLLRGQLSKVVRKNPSKTRHIPGPLMDRLVEAYLAEAKIVMPDKGRWEGVDLWKKEPHPGISFVVPNVDYAIFTSPPSQVALFREFNRILGRPSYRWNYKDWDLFHQVYKSTERIHPRSDVGISFIEETLMLGGWVSMTLDKMKLYEHGRFVPSLLVDRKPKVNPQTVLPVGGKPTMTPEKGALALGLRAAFVEASAVLPADDEFLDRLRKAVKDDLSGYSREREAELLLEAWPALRDQKKRLREEEQDAKVREEEKKAREVNEEGSGKVHEDAPNYIKERYERGTGDPFPANLEVETSSGHDGSVYIQVVPKARSPYHIPTDEEKVELGNVGIGEVDTDRDYFRERVVEYLEEGFDFAHAEEMAEAHSQWTSIESDWESTWDQYDPGDQNTDWTDEVEALAKATGGRIARVGARKERPISEHAQKAIWDAGVEEAGRALEAALLQPEGDGWKEHEGHEGGVKDSWWNLYGPPGQALQLAVLKVIRNELGVPAGQYYYSVVGLDKKLFHGMDFGENRAERNFVSWFLYHLLVRGGWVVVDDEAKFTLEYREPPSLVKDYPVRAVRKAKEVPREPEPEPEKKVAWRTLEENPAPPHLADHPAIVAYVAMVKVEQEELRLTGESFQYPFSQLDQYRYIKAVVEAIGPPKGEIPLASMVGDSAGHPSFYVGRNTFDLLLYGGWFDDDWGSLEKVTLFRLVVNGYLAGKPSATFSLLPPPKKRNPGPGHKELIERAQVVMDREIDHEVEITGIDRIDLLNPMSEVLQFNLLKVVVEAIGKPRGELPVAALVKEGPGSLSYRVSTVAFDMLLRGGWMDDDLASLRVISGSRTHEYGPEASGYLRGDPSKDWTLLKHLPAKKNPSSLEVVHRAHDVMTKELDLVEKETGRPPLLVPLAQDLQAHIIKAVVEAIGRPEGKIPIEDAVHASPLIFELLVYGGWLVEGEVSTAGWSDPHIEVLHDFAQGRPPESFTLLKPRSKGNPQDHIPPGFDLEGWKKIWKERHSVKRQGAALKDLSDDFLEAIKAPVGSARRGPPLSPVDELGLIQILVEVLGPPDGSLTGELLNETSSIDIQQALFFGGWVGYEGDPVVFLRGLEKKADSVNGVGPRYVRTVLEKEDYEITSVWVPLLYARWQAEHPKGNPGKYLWPDFDVARWREAWKEARSDTAKALVLEGMFQGDIVDREPSGTSGTSPNRGVEWVLFELAYIEALVEVLGKPAGQVSREIWKRVTTYPLIDALFFGGWVVDATIEWGSVAAWHARGGAGLVQSRVLSVLNGTGYTIMPALLEDWKRKHPKGNPISDGDKVRRAIIRRVLKEVPDPTVVSEETKTLGVVINAELVKVWYEEVERLNVIPLRKRQPDVVQLDFLRRVVDILGKPGEMRLPPVAAIYLKGPVLETLVLGGWLPSEGFTNVEYMTILKDRVSTKGNPVRLLTRQEAERIYDRFKGIALEEIRIAGGTEGNWSDPIMRSPLGQLAILKMLREELGPPNHDVPWDSFNDLDAGRRIGQYILLEAVFLGGWMYRDPYSYGLMEEIPAMKGGAPKWFNILSGRAPTKGNPLDVDAVARRLAGRFSTILKEEWKIRGEEGRRKSGDGTLVMQSPHAQLAIIKMLVEEFGPPKGEIAWEEVNRLYDAAVGRYNVGSFILVIEALISGGWVVRDRPSGKLRVDWDDYWMRGREGKIIWMTSLEGRTPRQNPDDVARMAKVLLHRYVEIVDREKRIAVVWTSIKNAPHAQLGILRMLVEVLGKPAHQYPWELVQLTDALAYGEIGQPSGPLGEALVLGGWVHRISPGAMQNRAEPYWRDAQNGVVDWMTVLKDWAKKNPRPGKDFNYAKLVHELVLIAKQLRSAEEARRGGSFKTSDVEIAQLDILRAVVEKMGRPEGQYDFWKFGMEVGSDFHFSMMEAVIYGGWFSGLEDIDMKDPRWSNFNVTYSFKETWERRKLGNSPLHMTILKGYVPRKNPVLTEKELDRVTREITEKVYVEETRIQRRGLNVWENELFQVSLIRRLVEVLGKPFGQYDFRRYLDAHVKAEGGTYPHLIEALLYGGWLSGVDKVTEDDALWDSSTEMRKHIGVKNYWRRWKAGGKPEAMKILPPRKMGANPMEVLSTVSSALAVA